MPLVGHKPARLGAASGRLGRSLVSPASAQAAVLTVTVLVTYSHTEKQLGHGRGARQPWFGSRSATREQGTTCQQLGGLTQMRPRERESRCAEYAARRPARSAHHRSCWGLPTLPAGGPGKRGQMCDAAQTMGLSREASGLSGGRAPTCLSPEGLMMLSLVNSPKPAWAPRKTWWGNAQARVYKPPRTHSFDTRRRPTMRQLWGQRLPRGAQSGRNRTLGIRLFRCSLRSKTFLGLPSSSHSRGSPTPVRLTPPHAWLFCSFTVFPPGGCGLHRGSVSPAP